MKPEWYVRTATAIDILVDQSDDWIDLFRSKHCPSGAKGMPAHISLLYPFYSLHEVTDAVKARLIKFFAGQLPFECTLTEIRSFPKVAY